MTIIHLNNSLKLKFPTKTLLFIAKIYKLNKAVEGIINLKASIKASYFKDNKDSINIMEKYIKYVTLNLSFTIVLILKPFSTKIAETIGYILIINVMFPPYLLP